MLCVQAGVAAALPQAPAGGAIGSTNSLPPDTVTHDGFKVPSLPKHRTQSLPSTLGADAPQQQPGGAACSGAPEGAPAAEEEHAAAHQLPPDAPGLPPCLALLVAVLVVTYLKRSCTAGMCSDMGFGDLAMCLQCTFYQCCMQAQVAVD